MKKYIIPSTEVQHVTSIGHILDGSASGGAGQGSGQAPRPRGAGKVFFVALMAISLSLLTGCKGKNDPQSIISDQPTPSWTVSAGHDMTSSMSSIINVDLTLTYPKQIKDQVSALSPDDLLAAFAGDQCLGVTSLNNGLFFLFIIGPNADKGTEVTLRYYSAILKNTFIAKDPIIFSNDAQLGTVSAPYTPEFLVEKK